jgi:hypothetical protein
MSNLQVLLTLLPLTSFVVKPASRRRRIDASSMRAPSHVTGPYEQRKGVKLLEEHRGDANVGISGSTHLLEKVMPCKAQPSFALTDPTN